VGHLGEMSRWRTAFEQRVADIDWDMRFIDPWSDGCWEGISWKGRRRRFLFGMSEFVRQRDYDGLESRYRDLCRELSDAKITQQIEQLSFEVWERQVCGVLRELIDTANDRSSDTIFLRIRPDLDWGGALGIHDAYEPSNYTSEPVNPDEPFEEFSYSPPEVDRPTPPFEEASKIFQEHPLNASTSPSGPALYLIARTVASFGKCLNQFDISQRVYFSCMWAVFQMR